MRRQSTKKCAHCSELVARAAFTFCSNRCRGLAQIATTSYSDRFWSRVDKNGPIPSHRPELGPCWIWTGIRCTDGYGQFCFKGRHRRAPVVAYILTTGHEPPPETPWMLHHCDNGPIGCVRPEHIFPGTHADNMADCFNKGRQARGEKNGTAKLTADLVRQIRREYSTGSTSNHRLAAAYGVGSMTINNILRRKSWAHIE